MTERRDDQGYAVSPARLGGSGSRGPGRGLKLGALIALTVGVAIVGVGWLGPRLSAPPRFDAAFFATPVPEATPTPAPSATAFQHAAGPTPLPTLTRSDDGTFAGRVGVWGDGFRVLDLGAGTMSQFSTNAVAGNDAMIRSPDGGGWLCVCMSDRSIDTTPPQLERDVQLVRIDSDGRELYRSTLTTLSGTTSPDGNTAVQTDLATAPDGRSAVLVAGRHQGKRWHYSAWRIDLAAESIGAELPIGQVDLPGPPKLPSPAPGSTPAVVHTDASGPTIRRSPDGRTAVVWASVYQGTDDSLLSSDVSGWRLTIDANGEPTSAAVADGLRELPAYCSGIGFVRNDLIAAVCGFFATDPVPAGAPTWWVYEFGADGRKVAATGLPEPTHWYTEPLFDTANGLLWVWDPAGLDLVRIDSEGLGIASTRLDPLADSMPGLREYAVGPASWSRPRSAVNQFNQSELAGAPDGSRLYLVGYREQPGVNADALPSAGVFVVDPRTLAVVDRWSPDAMYVSIEPILGGRAFAVTGAPGVDAGGRSAPWQGSITIHDAVDGRILMRFGQLGDGFYPQVLGS